MLSRMSSARQPFGLPGEHPRDEFVAAGVVIEHPGREPDRRILERVQRLRPIAHLLCVAQAVLVEVGELFVGEPSRRRKDQTARASDCSALCDLVRDGGGMLV
jgi:hypothetical protein